MKLADIQTGEIYGAVLIRHTSPDQLLEAIEDTIREAVKQAREKGIEIVSGKWGGDGKCCALGAFYAVKPTDRARSATSRQALGINYEQQDAFVQGFDGGYYPPYHRSMYDMGRKLRKEFIG